MDALAYEFIDTDHWYRDKLRSAQEKLQPVSLGNSGNLRVGQQVRSLIPCYRQLTHDIDVVAPISACLDVLQVLCIGNPFGFDHTLTTGVISGVEREIQSRAGVLIGGGIQTDAAINPGINFSIQM